MVALVVALFVCLTVLMTGCSMVKVLEKDVQVILYDRDTYVGTYTVNAFNNAYVAEQLQAPQKGYRLAGWTTKQDWNEQTDSLDIVTENALVIRYDDVKDYGKSSLIMYSAYELIPQHDLAIAWYDKESTSGLNQTHIDTFTEQLYQFLESKGYKPDEMDIVIRGYQGNVGTTCSNIINDGDIDIMIGWSTTSNLTGTGGLVEGVDFIENNDGVTIGAKERYSARLTDKELTIMVYNWIFETYGEPLEQPEEPEEPKPEDPNAEDILVIGWYSKSGTSGLDQTIIDKFAQGLNTYLASQGYTSDNLTVTFKGYDGVVDEVQTAVESDNNVDVMLGMKAFSVAGIVETQENVAMGVKTDRRIHLLDDNTVSRLVFEWLKTEEARQLLV